MHKILIVAAIAAAASAPAAANLIVNGDFEVDAVPSGSPFVTTGALFGWNVNNSIDLIGSYWAASSGAQSIDLNSTVGGSISQAFATTLGQQYRLSFDLAGNPDGDPDAKLLAVLVRGGGVNELVSFDAGATSRSEMSWVSNFYDFVGTGSTMGLVFSSRVAGAYGPALDNVAVNAVPEPGSWAILLAGLGLMGWTMRRRGAS